MSFDYTSINFDHNDAFPLAGDADAVATAMMERGELACTVLRVLDALEDGQGHTIGFGRMDDMGYFNPVDSAAMRGEGYVVAHREIARVKSVGGTDFRSLMGDIADNARSVATSDGIGVWSDPDTGELVLDAVRVYLDRDNAECAGRAYLQYSIYDIANEKEIVL